MKDFREKIDDVVPENIGEQIWDTYLLPVIRNTTLFLLVDHIESDGMWSHQKVLAHIFQFNKQKTKTKLKKEKKT